MFPIWAQCVEKLETSTSQTGSSPIIAVMTSYLSSWVSLTWHTIPHPDRQRVYTRLVRFHSFRRRFPSRLARGLLKQRGLPVPSAVKPGTGSLQDGGAQSLAFEKLCGLTRGVGPKCRGVTRPAAAGATWC